MLENLRITNGLRDKILADAFDYLQNHLEQNTYSPNNNIIPINETRNIIVSHLSGRYSSRIFGEDQGILVRETLRPIVEQAATQLGFERMYLEKTSEKGRPLEGRILEDEITDERTRITRNPIYWIRNQSSFDN